MAAEKWYEAPSGVVIRRYASDNYAAEEIAAALQNGWAVLSHNIAATPSLGVWFFILALFRRTEHVITFVKASAD
jgi:hypothetical protein